MTRQATSIVASAYRWSRAKAEQYATRAAIVLAVLLIPSHQLYDVENSVFDVLVKIRYLRGVQANAGESQRTVIVVIDDEARRTDTNALLRDESLTSRRYLAALVRKLAESRPPPSVVGLDFRLDRPSVAAEDALLEAAINYATSLGIRIVLPTVLVDSEMVTHPLIPLDRFIRAKEVDLGFANFLRSSTDGVVRRFAISFPLLENEFGQWYAARGLDEQLPILIARSSGERPKHWSFAAALFMASGAHRRQEVLLSQLESQPPYWIDYAAPSHRRFHILSSAQVLNGAQRQDLGNAIVIVGTWYEGSKDRVPTSLSSAIAPVGRIWGVGSAISQPLPGVLVHAYALDTLKQHASAGLPVYPGPWVLTALAAVIGVGHGWLHSRKRAFVASPIAVAVIAASYAALSAWFFISGRGLLPVIRPLAGYIVAYAIALAAFARRAKAP